MYTSPVRQGICVLDFGSLFSCEMARIIVSALMATTTTNHPEGHMYSWDWQPTVLLPLSPPPQKKKKSTNPTYPLTFPANQK